MKPDRTKENTRHTYTEDNEEIGNRRGTQPRLIRHDETGRRAKL